MRDSGRETEALFTVTDAARRMMVDDFDALRKEGAEAVGARLKINGRSSEGFAYGFDYLQADEVKADDLVVDLGAIRVYVDPASAPDLAGAKVDYITESWGGGRFHVDNPNPIWRDERSARIAEIIDTQINPAIAMHGGRCDLLEVDGGVVYVRMGGGCQGCGMVDVTLKQGIEAMVKEQFPEVEKVVDTTDHASGTNPYYRPGKG